MLQYVEAGNRVEDLRMNVLQAINFIIQAWDGISAEIIHNCWCHTKILPNINVDLRNISEDIHRNENLELNDLADALQALNLPIQCKRKSFLTYLKRILYMKSPKMIK